MSEAIIAVMSDLHCHHSRKFTKEQPAESHSYLTADLIELPQKHPIDALITALNQDGIERADLLLCPGDIAHQVDIQGYLSGWKYIKEVGLHLKAKIVATLGNHDVDSRHNLFPHDIFYIANRIGKDYPFVAEDSVVDKFWSQGFCFIEYPQIRVLLINSVKFHSAEEEVICGRMDDKQIQAINDYLKLTKNDSKIQIAMCHHHPIEHSRWKLGTEDLIVLGGQLVDILNKYNFDLLIHGHKHDPWLRYSQGNGSSMPIFSAGSFSATSNVLFTSVKNTFHIIELSKNGQTKACGHIRTWEFLPAQGWRLADSGDEFFPQHSGFGFSGNIEDLIAKAITILNEGNKEFIDWEAFRKQLIEVDYLTPDECIKFRDRLLAHGIITHPNLPRLPTLIGKPHKA